ncbi:MAG: hypothetical protein J6T48_09580 [Bacteroidales bacterium]|nr:hypothetical protein [Bacteroidales bacterium]
MKTIFKTLAIAALAFSMFACQRTPDRSDLEGREEKLSKEVENINIQQIYRDIMMLYCDVIEDIYKEGKESGEYDLKRLEDLENGLIADFEDKMNFNNKDLWDELDEKYDESLKERMESVRPMIEDMFGEEYNDDEDYNEPRMLEDSSVVIGKDTIKELEDGRIILNRDTLTEEEFLNKFGIDE